MSSAGCVINWSCRAAWISVCGFVQPPSSHLMQEGVALGTRWKKTLLGFRVLTVRP